MKIDFIKINLKIIVLILFILSLSSCAEKISHSGKIWNTKDNIYNFKTKKEIISYFGYPNYIDPIEKKYFYYSQKRISKNFFNNKTIYKKLLIFTFNPDDTIKLINEYDINEKNKTKIIKDQTESNVIQKGLLEKIFGGVGKGATPTTP